MKKPKVFTKQIPSKDLVSEITNAIVDIYSLSPREYSSNLFHDLAIGFKSLIYAMEQDRGDPNVVHPLFIKWFKLYVWLQHQVNQKDDIRAKFESKIPVCSTYILASLQYQNSISNYHQNIMEMFLTVFESAEPHTIQNIVNLDMEIIAQLWMPVEFVGDYITQRQCLKLIAAVLKHLNLEERRKRVFETKLNEELQKLILKLAADPNNFEEISRELLNSYNMNYSRNSTVFSVYCTKALLESSEIFKPEKVSKCWIDFNYTSKTVSLLFQLNKSERKQVELYVQMKIDKLQMTNQLECSVFSIQPAFFSSDVPAYLRNARLAVFTLPKTQVERLKANSSLFHYYNTFSSDVAPTPNTIEQYLLECSDDSPYTPYTPYTGEGNIETPTIKSPMVKLPKYNPETIDPTNDSNDGQNINLTISDMPMSNGESTTSLSRVENFVKPSVPSLKESGYNTFAKTNTLEDTGIYKKPEIPPLKRKRNVKASTLLEPMKNTSMLQSEETLAGKQKTKPRKTNDKPSNSKKQIKLPVNKEETGASSLFDHQSEDGDVPPAGVGIQLTRHEETYIKPFQQQSKSNKEPALKEGNLISEKSFQVQRQENEERSIQKPVSKPGRPRTSQQQLTKEGTSNQKSIQDSHVISAKPIKQMPLLVPTLSPKLEELQTVSDTRNQSRRTRKSCPTQNISTSIVESNEQESSRRKPLGSIVNPIQRPAKMPLLLPQLSQSSQELFVSTPKLLTNIPKTSKLENPQVSSGISNLLSNAESILPSSNCEPPPQLHEGSNNLEEESQLPQGPKRRFFKTNILRNSVPAAKAKPPKSRKKTEREPPTDTKQKIIEKPKNVNRVKPLNYLTEPEDTAQGSTENHVFGLQTERNDNRKSAAELPKENLSAIQKQTAKRRSRKQKTLLKDVEVSQIVPYSVWKRSQNKKNNSDNELLAMRSPRSEQENEVVPRSTRQQHRKEETVVANFEASSPRKIRKKAKNNIDPPKILSQRLNRPNKITEPPQSSSDLFDRLKNLNIDNQINLTSNKFVPLAYSSSSSSVSNGNFIILDSDEEDEGIVDPIQEINGEQVSRWIDMVRSEQPQQTMLSPVAFPFDIAERSIRTKSNETILTPVKMSLELDDFPVVSPSQQQNESNRSLQNMLTTNYMSPVYEVLDDEIPVDQTPTDDDHPPLEEISRPASKHFSDAESGPTGREPSIQPFSLQSEQHGILPSPHDDNTQSEELSLMPSNSEFVEEFLQEVTELRQSSSSHGSLISVYERSQSNNQECSALRVQQNFTNQLIVQHHHYVLGPQRKRIHSSENSEASPAKMSALTQYTPLKGYAELLPNFTEKLTTEKDRVLLDLETKLNNDIFQNVNETFEAVTKSIDYHETAIEKDEEEVFSLLEKLEWHQKSLQQSQLELEKIQKQIVERTQKSLNEEDTIDKLYNEAMEGLKTYADVVKKEQWQNFSKDIIDSISKRLTRLSNI